ncbi:hypothetical protein [Shewanella donghaensis]|uniref:hypothetical protein n=1 Tax=Shewanella donghaensis TaxID=238836 RepID=UPI001181FBA5|nr:hypothetical protein [Shewanella donghaensis]
MLISIFFFLGSITRENAPIQIHFIMTLMVPFYLLLMPLLFAYCKTCLQIKVSDNNIIKHLLPSLISMVVIAVAVSFNIGLSPDAIHIKADSISELSHINMIALVMPAVIMCQSGLYFVLIARSLRQHKRRFKLTSNQTLKDIRFRWLLILTGGILINWSLRLIIVLLPFYLGDTVSSFTHDIARLAVLLTVYGFAIYGLHQITRAAYLRSNNNISQSKSAKQGTPAKASEQLLNSEELNYLQSIMREEDTTEKRLH